MRYAQHVIGKHQHGWVSFPWNRDSLHGQHPERRFTTSNVKLKRNNQRSRQIVAQAYKLGVVPVFFQNPPHTSHIGQNCVVGIQVKGRSVEGQTTIPKRFVQTQCPPRFFS